MKNIYLAQPNYMFGDNVHLPYSIGVLAAMAFSDETIKKHYSLKKIIFLRNDINDVVDEIDKPFLIGFSCYIWNYEYNRRLAFLIKSKFPNCIILFGGHQIKNNSIDELKENSFVDIISYGEGEQTFKNILLELISGGWDLSNVPNISYANTDGEIITTKTHVEDNIEYISPYTMGLFDDLIDTYPQYTFNATLETNRGCPFGCAYCDWGGVNHKLRIFNIDDVRNDITWMAEKKIEYVAGADANFGILDRDNQIIDLLIEAKRKWGYPKTFRVAYTKNSSEKIFLMNMKLNEYGMAKGATLSFQSLNPVALENVGRKNIEMNEFFSLLNLYHAHNISTYSEMIIGLPGETYDSWCNGIGKLLDYGQHTSLNIYNCELLKNSKLANDSIIDKFNIETVKIPLNQYHMLENNDDIAEYSNIIVKTVDMSKEDWVKMNVFSWAIQCFHCLGLLQMFSIYLRFEKDIDYSIFYNSLICYLKKSPSSVGGMSLSRVDDIYKKALNGFSIVYKCENTDNLLWPTEEGSFIEIIEQKDLFYSEIETFLKSFGISNEVYDDLLKYQKNILNSLNASDININLEFDWHSYYSNIYKNRYRPIEHRKNTLHINNSKTYDNLYDYAIQVVWYGRKGGNNLHSDVEIFYHQ